MGKIGENGAAASKLPFRQLLGYGLGHVFNDICASLWFTYLLIFLQKVSTFFGKITYMELSCKFNQTKKLRKNVHFFFHG